MTCDVPTSSRPSRRRFTLRHVAASVWFQTLEPRQLMSIDSPSPADGMDYHFVLDDSANAAPVISASPDPVARKPLPQGFTWFDGTANSQLHAAHPELFDLAEVNGYDVWPYKTGGVGIDTHGELSETRTRALARNMNGKIDVLVIDIEHWPIDLRGATRESIAVTVNKLVTMFGWMRQEAPGLKLAFYGHLSLSDAWASNQYPGFGEVAATGGNPWYNASLPRVSDSFADWQVANEILRPLADSVDYVMPSIYTGASTVSEWVAYARYTIEDSRRYGKPVIPFIWPQYHDAVPTLGGQYLPPEMWQAQLDTVRQYADGGMIWLGTGPSADPNLPWVTKLVNQAQTDLVHRTNLQNQQLLAASAQTSPSASVGSALLSSDTDLDSLFSDDSFIV
jgi:hypothetical protein